MPTPGHHLLNAAVCVASAAHHVKKAGEARDESYMSVMGMLDDVQREIRREMNVEVELL